MIPWIRRQRLRTFFRTSMWMVPLTCTLLALLVVPAIRGLDANLQLTLLGFDVEGARGLLDAFVAASISYIVFLASALLIAVQLMSAYLSPRVIREFMVNWWYRIVLGLFAFTFVYSIAALARTTRAVPQLTVFVAVVLNVASIGAFLYLIDYVLRNFRPSAVVNRVSAQGLIVIEDCYPFPSLSPENEEPLNLGRPVRTIAHSGRSGVILAVDVEGLVARAKQAGSVFALLSQVGDFVAKGEELVNVYIAGESIDETVIAKSIAFGPERTMEQDPSFAFRILVDIAIKALSPAINDPTTAVLALDQLQRLLLKIGGRQLDAGPVLDDGGHERLYIAKPHWQDFMSLAISEIRIYGSGSLQVCRRLEAMIKNMVDILPRYRTPALIKELELLRSGVERQFPDPEDRLRAITPDALGLGGGHHW
ncbi:MAG: DUF2254 domain-containing protein [Syntrophobacteraceae bacterium]